MTVLSGSQDSLKCAHIIRRTPHGLTAIGVFESVPSWLHISRTGSASTPQYPPPSDCSRLREVEDIITRPCSTSRSDARILFVAWRPLKDIVRSRAFELTPRFNLRCATAASPREPRCSCRPALCIGYPTFNDTERNKLHTAGGTARFGHSGSWHNRLSWSLVPRSGSGSVRSTTCIMTGETCLDTIYSGYPNLPSTKEGIGSYPGKP